MEWSLPIEAALTAMMRGTARTAGLMAMMVFGIQCGASAQDVERQVKPVEAEDHALVLEIGAVVDWERAERAVHGGGTFAFEVTPVENQLELEIGIAAIRADGGVEMPIDVLFKKPWRFSPQFEFMIGAGPEIVHASGPNHATFWGVVAVLDFMFWPRKNIGWYVEPGYEITFRGDTPHHGLGVSAGLLIGR
jgi:hypothetical protein